MKARQLYALTPSQAFLVQHSITAHQTDGTFMAAKTRRSLDDAWQMLSRPIHVQPKFARALKRVKRTPKRPPLAERAPQRKSPNARKKVRKRTK